MKCLRVKDGEKKNNRKRAFRKDKVNVELFGFFRANFSNHAENFNNIAISIYANNRNIERIN